MQKKLQDGIEKAKNLWYNQPCGNKDKEGIKMKYDVIIIGAGPGGIFSAYELTRQNQNIKVAVFESGHELSKRHCPIDGDKIKSCIRYNS